MSGGDEAASPDSSSQRLLLESLLGAGLRAVHAGNAVRAAMRYDDRGCLEVAGSALPQDARLVVFAAGKAASAMAAAAEDVAGDRIRTGLVVTKQGHGRPLENFSLLEAGHPVPDARSEDAARAALALVSEARSDEVLLVLLSGGASALLSCPQAGLSGEDLAATTQALLACGADIHELNCVRKQVSELAGGRLARAAAAGRIEVLAVSDVPGDSLDVIASGPCQIQPPDPSGALEVLDRYRLRGRVPAAVVRHLEAGGSSLDQPGSDLAQIRSKVVARSFDAANAVAAAAEQQGLRGLWLGPVLRGEARERGRELARMALGLRVDRPTCLIASGETTVTLRGRGRGGRSQELALAAAQELAGQTGVCMLAAGTDGTDGPTDAAGAYVDRGTVARGLAHDRVAAADLEHNDSYGFFSLEGGLLRTGPTDTNVMDLVLIGVGIG